MKRRFILYTLTGSMLLPAMLRAQKVTSVIPLQMENIEGYSRYNYDETYPEDEEYSWNNAPAAIYQASHTRINDILHIDLAISFNIAEATATAAETLKVKPYNRPVDSLHLDAKGILVHEIALLEGGRKIPLQYTNTGYQLLIALNRRYTRNENYQIVINYTARPNELATNAPLLDPYERGLYFIRPDAFFPYKPTQIWTQGETEANSVWLPMIDKPNERFTHTFAITVPEKLSSLSNGLLKSSKTNGNGTRTDVWVNDKENAAYLVMLAAGEFAIVKDKWRNIETAYYVEKPYADDAREIFAYTGEMLSFFSDLLGTPYPWQKYSQIVVRDYVSGAMENTSAVVFGQFVQRHKAELGQHSNELIVAHEMFHHWFGDLVTCESWANLPLNESFANYSEYLWLEHKYGRWKADEHNLGEKEQYFNEAESKEVNLIRFDYENRNDMFDSHSYAKGGRILHMLRYYLGSETFFEGLKLYLKTNAGKPVEAHQLRLAFEEVSGEDLNWFFNQWFFDKGHPSLEVVIAESVDDKSVTMDVLQYDYLDNGEPYRLPVEVDVYFSDGTKKREQLLLSKASEVFELRYDKPIANVNFDAEKVLLCSLIENKSLTYWEHQWKNAPLFEDRLSALKELARNGTSIPIFTEALRSKSPALQKEALSFFEEYGSGISEEEAVYDLLGDIVFDASESYEVRIAVLNVLAAAWDPEAALALCEGLLSDPQADVAAAALKRLARKSAALAEEKAAMFENSETSVMIAAVADIYARRKTPGKFEFFKKNMDACYDLSDKMNFMDAYIRYITKMKDLAELEYAEGLFLSMLENECYVWLRYSAYEGIDEICKVYRSESRNNPGLKDRIRNLTELYNLYKGEEKNPEIAPYLNRYSE